MTEMFWLVGAAFAVATWIYVARRGQRQELGALSARWLHDYRRETHHEP